MSVLTHFDGVSVRQAESDVYTAMEDLRAAFRGRCSSEKGRAAIVLRDRLDAYLACFMPSPDKVKGGEK